MDDLPVPVFACPFLKRNPKDHLACRTYELTRIRDVKQHLTRKHLRREYCPVCYETFGNETKKDDHIRAQQCQARPPIEIDGVSRDQQKLLSKRSNSKHTDEQQWYSIWEVLFPNTDHPDSVYLNQAFSDNMFLLREYMVTEGVGVTRDFLNTHGATQWTLPVNEEELASFQHRLVRGALETLFEGMNDFVKELETQPSSTPADPPKQESPAPTSSRIASMTNTNSSRGLDQDGYAASLDNSDILFSETSGAGWGSIGSYQTDSQFTDMMFDMLEPDY